MEKQLVGIAAVIVILAIGSAQVYAKTIDIKQNAYIQGNPGFDPKSAMVKVGEPVIWHNSDTVPHTATSGAPNDPTAGSIFNTHTIAPGSDSAMVKISKAGDVNYFCQIHPFIVGKLTAH